MFKKFISYKYITKVGRNKKNSLTAFQKLLKSGSNSKALVAALILAFVFLSVIFPVTQPAIAYAANTNYISNRAPLLDTPFISLPIGSVRANGWLLKQLELQKEGLTGNSEVIYPELKSNSAWLGGNAANSDWERPTYYVRGLVALAYVLNDATLKARAQKWIDWAISSQRADGSFGPVSNDDWWPRMPMLDALMDYYEGTNDSRVISFMTRYFSYQRNSLSSRPLRDWGKARAGDNVNAVLWLYNRTGDSNLLTLADTLQNQGYNWPDIFTNNKFLTSFHQDLMVKHSVNVAQSYKNAAIYYQKSNSALDRDAFMEGHNHLLPYHTQIHDMNSGTEALSGNASIQGVELCSIVERMLSNEQASRILGDARIGDQLEKITFNALPGALDEYIHQHQYYILPNQVQSKAGSNGFGQDYANGIVPGPYSGFPCCRYNLHMGWPKYVQNSWMATTDNGLAVTAYGPTTVTAKVAAGVNVTFTEDTNYPFEEQMRFTLSSGQSVKFPLKLRIPSWCTSPTVKVNGVVQTGVAPGTYYTINRTWNNGDTVTLDVPMTVKTSTWVNNSVGIERGPLVYSLKIDENWSRLTNYSFNGIDFSEYQVFPKIAWNYGLVIDRSNPEASITVSTGPMPDNPFRPGTTPVKLLASAKKIPSWGLDVNGIHAAEPPYSPVASTQPTEQVTLIPFGAERIRLTYFPVIGTPAGPSTSFTDNFATGGPNKWVNFGGGWQQSNGKYYSESYNIPGVKSIAMGTNFSDLVYDLNINISNTNTQGGALFRVNNPANGTDAYQGYYAGINTAGNVILGKANNGWTQLASVNMTVTPGVSYHMRVIARGSNIKVFVGDMVTPKIDVNDSAFTSGAIGLRQYSGTGTPDLSGHTVVFDSVNVQIPAPTNAKSSANLAVTGAGAKPVYTAAHAGSAAYMNDGIKNNQSVDSWTGAAKPNGDAWGYIWAQPYNLNKAVYTTGKGFADGGWYASGLKVQVLQNGTWIDVNGLTVSAAYPYNNTAVPYRSYTFSFNDTWGDGVRIIGAPGGTASFTSICELEAYYSPAPVTATDSFNGPLSSVWTWSAPLPGPTNAFINGNLRLAIPGTNIYDQWINIDNSPKLTRTDMGSGDWVIDTKVNLTSYTAGSSFIEGLIVKFGTNNYYLWGNLMGQSLELSRSGVPAILSVNGYTNPTAYLRIEKITDTYYFYYKANEGDAWICAGSSNYAGAVVSVGLMGKTWANVNVTADYDYFALMK